MSDIWRAEISLDGISLTGVLPADPSVGPNNGPVLGSYIFLATDTNHNQLWGIEARLQLNTYGPGPTYEWQTVYIAWHDGFAPSPNMYQAGWYAQGPRAAFLGGLPIAGILTPYNAGSQVALIITEVNGMNGAAWFAGGTLAIEKDFGGNLVTFVTPLGNMTYPLNAFFTPATNDPLYPSGMGHGMHWDLATPDTPARDTERWHNFYSYKNGVFQPDFSLTLAANDAGIWNGWIDGESDEPIFDNFDMTEMATDDAQEMTRFRTSFVYPGGSAFSGQQSTEVRFILAFPPMGGVALDLTKQPEFNLLWGAWTDTALMTEVKVRRSADDGHTWTDFLALTGGDMLVSASIQVYAGGVYLCYYDMTAGATLQTVSQDAGLTWSSPMPISISGTNPRLVINRDGHRYYFSISGSNIVLQRSFDQGSTLFDASPLTVASGVPAQDFGATFAADGTLAVAYSDANMNWVTRISGDMGLSWRNA